MGGKANSLSRRRLEEEEFIFTEKTIVTANIDDILRLPATTVS